MAPFIDADQLRQRLNYDPITGNFTWKAPKARCKPGDPAGSWDLHGYLTVRIDGRSYKLHRLAWLYVHGEWPEFDIDHINGTRSDNRIENLRDVPRAANLQNTKNPKRNLSTGVMGVYRVGNRFNTKISINNKCKDLGTYDTLEQARSVYLAAKRLHHTGFVE